MAVPIKLSSPWQRVYFSELIRFQLNIKRKLPLRGQSNTGRQLHREVATSQPNCTRTWTACSCQPFSESTGCIIDLQRCPLASPILQTQKKKKEYLIFLVLITSLVSSSPHSLKQESQDQCKKETIVLVWSLS